MTTWLTGAVAAAAVTAAAVLAGCGSSTPGAPAPPAATLTVHVGVFGGPALPNGKMAASNAPQPGAAIVLTGSGRRWTMHTDADGNARFAVPTGRYSVRGPCPPGKRITLTAGRTTVVQLPCEVP